MNKKVVWGCLGTTVALAIVGTALLWFFVVRPIGAIVGDLEKITELQAMNEKLDNQDSFVAEDGMVLTEDDAARFQRVQTAMGNNARATYSQLRDRMEPLERMLNEEGNGPGFREALDAIHGLGEMLPTVKAAQIEALNREGFSMEEYRWVREQMYWALNQPDPTLYLEDIASEFSKMTQSKGATDFEIEPGRRPELPDATIAVASAYADSMDAWSVFRLFGL